MARKAELQGEINLNSTKLQRVLNKAQAKIKAFAASAAKSFGLAFAALGGASLVRGAIELGSRISDLAVQLRIGAEALQVLQFAAKKAGVESSVLERALRNVQTRAQQAADGNKSYGEALDRLGINIEAFRKLRPEEQLEAIAIAQQKATDKTAAYNDVAIILGQRAGPEMQEVLKSLAEEGFPALAKAAEEAGQVMDKETIKKLDEASDRITLFKNKVTILSGEILVKAMPVLSIFGEALSFLGAILKASALNVASLGRALVDVARGAMQPTLSVVEALSKGFEGLKAFLDGDFARGKELFGQARLALMEIKGEIKAMPVVISKAFTDIKNTATENFEAISKAGIISTIGIAEAINKLTEKNKDAADENKNNLNSTKDTVEELKDEIIETEEATGEAGDTLNDAFGDTTAIDTLTDKVRNLRDEASSFDDLDFNQDGIITGREERQGASLARKQESEARRAMTGAVAAGNRPDISGIAARRQGRRMSGPNALDTTSYGRTPLTGPGSQVAIRPMTGLQPAGMQAQTAKGMAGGKGGGDSKWQEAIIEMKQVIVKLEAGLAGD